MSEGEGEWTEDYSVPVDCTYAALSKGGIGRCSFFGGGVTDYVFEMFGRDVWGGWNAVNLPEAGMCL